MALVSLLFLCSGIQLPATEAYFVLKGSRAAQNFDEEPFVFAHVITVGATGASTVRFKDPDAFEFPTIPSIGTGENDIVFPATSYSDQRQLRIDMEAIHLDGIYELTLNGTIIAPLEISVFDIPVPASPHILNMVDLTNANPNLDVTIQWAPFHSGDTNDYIHFRLISEILENRPEPQQVVFSTMVLGQPATLAATNTTLTVPRGTLKPNSRYWAKLHFVDVRTTDTNTVPGAIGYSGLFSQTTFFVDTGNATALPDTTPPLLDHTLPATGATISSTETLQFHFNEPMQPAGTLVLSPNAAVTSARWRNGDNVTTGPNVYEVVISTSAGASELAWTLSGFKDLSGNPAVGASGTFQVRSQEPLRFLSPLLLENAIEFELLVPTNVTYTVESSTDLQSWAPFRTNVAVQGRSIISVLRTEKPREFFRARRE